MERPNPVPSPAGFVVKKGLNIFSFTSEGTLDLETVLSTIVAKAVQLSNTDAGDPVGSGFAASLAHPGGNITGVFSDFPDFCMKWLELLKETVPTLSSAVVLWDPATGRVQLDAVQAAGRLLNVKLEVVEIRAIAELEHGFATAAERRPDAMVILSSPIFGTNPKLIAELTLAHQIPTATLFADIARAGGLIAYGPNFAATFRQTGTLERYEFNLNRFGIPKSGGF